jgi:hypothetical protein
MVKDKCRKAHCRAGHSPVKERIPNMGYPQITGHRRVKDISTDRNINNNLRKSVSSVDEFLSSASLR